jgi:hypothetical protein
MRRPKLRDSDTRCPWVTKSAWGSQGLGDGRFLLGVAGAELAHHPVDADAFLAAARGHGLDLFHPGLGGDGPAVVDASGQDVVLAAERICVRVNSRSGNDEHAHLFGAAGDDGVGGQGRAQVDGADFRPFAILQDGAQRLGDGREQVVVIRRDLGHGFHPPVPDADAVRVRSSDIYSDKHKSDPWADGWPRRVPRLRVVSAVLR